MLWWFPCAGLRPQGICHGGYGRKRCRAKSFPGSGLKVKLIIPNLPATFSAWGMLVTDLRQDFIQTQIMPVEGADLDKINTIYNEMEEEARRIFKEQNIAEENIVFMRTADLRYVGQEHAVTTPMRGGYVDMESVNLTRKSFDRLHHQHYAFSMESAAAEFVNFNLTAFGVVKKPEIKKIASSGPLEKALKGERYIDFEEHGRLMSKDGIGLCWGPVIKLKGRQRWKSPSRLQYSALDKHWRLTSTAI